MPPGIRRLRLEKQVVGVRLVRLLQDEEQRTPRFGLFVGECPRAPGDRSALAGGRARPRRVPQLPLVVRLDLAKREGALQRGTDVPATSSSATAALWLLPRTNWRDECGYNVPDLRSHALAAHPALLCAGALLRVLFVGI